MRESGLPTRLRCPDRGQALGMLTVTVYEKLDTAASTRTQHSNSLRAEHTLRTCVGGVQWDWNPGAFLLKLYVASDVWRLVRPRHRYRAAGGARRCSGLRRRPAAQLSRPAPPGSEPASYRVANQVHHRRKDSMSAPTQSTATAPATPAAAPEASGGSSPLQSAHGRTVIADIVAAKIAMQL
jgi:hypothetical protein